MKNITLENYQLQGNPVIDVPVPRIGNLIYDDLGELVLARLNEQFKGVKNIEDTHKYKKGERLSYSNVPRVLAIQQILSKELPNTQVLDPFQLVQYWNIIPDKSTTYADTNAVSVFPNPGPNELLRKRILDLLGTPEIKTPLLVTNLGVEKADNDYGFTFTKTPYTRSREVPVLQKNQRVIYDPATKNLIPSSDESGVGIWTPSNQDGLRRACRGRGGDVYCGDDGLLGSYLDGGVQILQDPKGLGAENFDTLIRELKSKRDKQVGEVNSRFEAAKEYLLTGKFNK